MIGRIDKRLLDYCYDHCENETDWNGIVIRSQEEYDELVHIATWSDTDLKKSLSGLCDFQYYIDNEYYDGMVIFLGGGFTYGLEYALDYPHLYNLKEFSSFTKGLYKQSVDNQQIKQLIK